MLKERVFCLIVPASPGPSEDIMASVLGFSEKGGFPRKRTKSLSFPSPGPERMRYRKTHRKSIHAGKVP